MKWNNEFEGLEEYISVLNENLTAKAERREESQSGYVLVLAADAKKNIKRIAFRIEKPKRRCEYIRRHQHALIRMWDQVYDYMDLTAKDEESRVSQSRSTPGARDLQSKPTVSPASGGQSPSLLRSVYASLEELHEFLMTMYPDCFNLHEQVAKGYLMKVRERFKIERGGLLAAVVKAKLPKKMVVALYHPFKAIDEGKDSVWTYWKVRWLEKFMREADSCSLLAVRQGKVAKNAKDTQRTQSGSTAISEVQSPIAYGGYRRFYTPMLKLLVYYDFNTTKLKNWLMDAIHEDADKMQTLEKKVERLKYHFLELSKLPVKEGNGYMHKVASLRDDVCRNIETEVRHLEERYELEFGISNREFGEKVTETISPGSSATDPRQTTQSKDAPYNDQGLQPNDNGSTMPAPANETGIYFGNSVPELGVLIAILQKVGIIRNVNRTQLAEFLARHCHTIGRDKFSDTNLYNAFGHKDRKTIERLHGKLMDAVNWLVKMKNQQ